MPVPKSTPRWRVMLTSPIAAEAQAGLAAHAELIVARDSQPDTLRKAARDVHAIIVRQHLPDDIFEHTPQLLGVIRHGVGMDLVPVQAATDKGIVTANVPGMNANAVAEYCVMAMLNLLRRPERADRALRSAGWDKSRAAATHGSELAARTVGIIGFGAIGSRLAHILHDGFGARVLVSSRNPQHLPQWAGAAGLETIVTTADFVVPCTPYVPATRHLLSRELIAKMPAHAFVVNASRGEVIDEAALIEALAGGRIAGAALDVFESKVLPAGHPITKLENALLTPHIAGHTEEAHKKNGIQAAGETLRVLAGEKPQNFFNPEVWEAAQARRRALGFA
jgi:D-3-phosphoglycerate dehydrogenase / 2-oxoglutarate reductase